MACCRFASPLVAADLRQQLHAQIGATIKWISSNRRPTGPDGKPHVFEMHPLRRRCTGKVSTTSRSPSVIAPISRPSRRGHRASMPWPIPLAEAVSHDAGNRAGTLRAGRRIGNDLLDDGLHLDTRPSGAITILRFAAASPATVRDHRVERSPQFGDAFRGQAGRNEQRSADLRSRRHELEHLPVLVRVRKLEHPAGHRASPTPS